uniref:Ubiquitin-like protease family profile domain-containing protein n=1 Tax=Oryza meridionalis TaxID=40149 RepID=A0A0E0E471_9ORYZ
MDSSETGKGPTEKLPNKEMPGQVDKSKITYQQIDLIANICQSEHKKPKKEDVIQIMPQDYICTEEDIQILCYVSQLPERQMVVDIGGAFLYKYDMNCLFHNDSYVNGDLKGLHRHIQFAAEHKELSQEKWQKLDVTTWPIIEMFPERMQTDGSSCGLWMLNYMEYWTGSKLSDRVTQVLNVYIHCIREEKHLINRDRGKEDITKFRSKLASILWCSKYNMRKERMDLKHEAISNLFEPQKSSRHSRYDTIHFMDLQFWILLPHSFLGHYTLFVLDMKARTVFILDPLHIPDTFRGSHPTEHYVHKIANITTNVKLAMEEANPTWNDDIYLWNRKILTDVLKTENWEVTGFHVLDFMWSWNGEKLASICTDGNKLRTRVLLDILKKEWIRSMKPYPISLSLRNLQDILDVNKSMDNGYFNMAVRMLTWNPLLLFLDDTIHFMDLQFWILLPHFFLGHYTLFVLDMKARTVFILDPLHIPNTFRGSHPTEHYVHKIANIATNVKLAMEEANPTWNDDIYLWNRKIPTDVPKTENWEVTGFHVLDFMWSWNGEKLASVCTDGNKLRTRVLLDILKCSDNEAKDNIPIAIQEFVARFRV